MKIVVYVRSNHIVLGIPKHQTIDAYTNACTQRSTYVLGDAVEDRLLEPESIEIAQIAGRLQQTGENSVHIVDVGFTSGRLQALLAGVLKVPAVVIGNMKYSGFDAARQALEQLCTEHPQVKNKSAR